MTPHRKAPAKKSEHEEAPAVPRRIGTVGVINPELHFVLIDAGSLYRPAIKRTLKTFHGGEETGTLSVSGEYRRPYVAADIVSGNPQVGDEVFE